MNPDAKSTTVRVRSEFGEEALGKPVKASSLLITLFLNNGVLCICKKKTGKPHGCKNVWTILPEDLHLVADLMIEPPPIPEFKYNDFIINGYRF